MWSNGDTAQTISINNSGSYSATAINGTCSVQSAPTIITVNQTPSVTSTTPNAICGAGTVTLAASANGGIINWYSTVNGGSLLNTGDSFTSPTISATTTYYVDATIGNCTTPTRTAVTATIDTLLGNITALGATTFCEGSSLMLMGNNGGTWSNGQSTNDITVNTSGNYYVVSSNSCGNDTSNTISITVNPLPVAPSISAMGNTSFCAGSSVMLMGNNGGTWSNGSNGNDVNVNTTGNYYVVSSNSCGNDTSNTISITVNSLPIAPIISANGSTNLCHGNSLILTGNNAGVWNDGSTASDTLIFNEGSYYVTTTNSCGSTVSNTINVNQISVDTAVTVGNASFLANASNATYQWLLCNGTYSPIPSETNQTFTPTMVSGFYAVEVTQNGCVDTSACYPLILTGHSNFSKIETVELYPNPAKNQLTVDNGQLQIGTLTIQNTLGEVIFYKQNCNALETIDVSGFASGIYILQTNQNSIKFIKQ